MTGITLVNEEGNRTETITPLASAARTASGNSGDIVVSKFREAVIFLDITAVSGTSPTLDMKVQRKDPLSGSYTDWDDATAKVFSQKSATGSFAIYLSDPLAQIIRISFTIGGSSPSFTFSVSVDAKAF